ncbi:hypothetical protein [Nesterenkonia sp. DZ6]|uniref:hypothetical protein n=1 Tax=Nesterenkonia sp. DZ6 TaxID=2901229 RepID=UPI001F4D0F78|nr:hypothetical protein [Nesterenkonia sp. DZ6]MCH8560348.1 hypothetical protein [Nesterenkonia sp. DZ6]
MVTALAARHMRPLEKDLEDDLSADLSLPGQDLLIIGRQVKTVGGFIDLLAIDSTGVVHIIELKLNVASPSAISQVLAYRRAIKWLNREAIIRLVGNGDLKINLVESFRRHFGHPLPATVNESQTLVIIAKSIHTLTADSILELREEGYPVPVTTFRYIRGSDAVRLIPCCRNDQNVEEGSHTGTTQSAPPNRIIALPKRSRRRLPIDEDIRRFWLTNVQGFGAFATFSFIFERYEDWVGTQPANGIQRRNKGFVGEQVRAITDETNEWSRVWVDRRSDLAVYNTIKPPPSVRTYRADNHAVAYQRARET